MSHDQTQGVHFEEHEDHEHGFVVIGTSPYTMTDDVLKKRAKKTHYGRIITQLYAGLLACLSSVSFGTALGWSGPVTQRLFESMEEGNEYITTKNFALLVCMVPLGCCFGIGSATFLLKQMGPKKSLLFVSPFYILTWWLMLIPKLDIQLVARFFLGLLGITYYIGSESLLHQTVHFAIRRYITVSHQSTTLLGVFLSTIAGGALDQFWLTVTCAVIPLVHLILLLPAPDSPVYLYATSYKAAAKSLAWYRGKNNIDLEMAQIKKDWDAERQDSDAYGYMLFAKVVYKALLIVIGVCFFQVCSGYCILLFFDVKVWTNGHTFTNNRITDSAVVAILFVVSKLFWGMLHCFFSWRVRPVLIASSLLTALALTGLSSFLLIDRTTEWVEHIHELKMFFIAAFLFSFDMGMNFYPKVLIFEYIPFQVFRKCYTILLVCFWVFSCAVLFSYAKLRLDTPSHVTFFTLSGLSFVGTFFCYFFVVEPRGKSLIQLQLELGGNPIGKRGALFNQAQVTL